MSRGQGNGYELASPDATPPAPSSYWVVQGLLLAGAYPGDSDPEKHLAKIQRLLDAGIRRFVNLMEEDETNWEGELFAPYDDLVERLCAGADCRRYPIRDVSVPTPSLMVDILDAIDESLAAGKPTYVHCWGGVGRTGTVIGCWLLRHGLADPSHVLETLARLRKQDRQRRHRMSPETPQQRRFVESWLETGERPRQ